MKNKFIKILSPLTLLLALILGNLLGCSDNSQAKRLQNIDESIKLSRSQLFQNDVDGAIETLQEAYSKHGESLSLCEALAYAYSQAEQYSSAAIYFEKAFKLSQNNLILLLNAGRAYEQCNAFDSALVAYENYLKIKPKDANIHREVAVLHAKQNHYQKSLNAYMDFVKNLSRNPNTAEACEIAKLFLKLKNISQSKAWFISALKACNASDIEIKSEILSGLIDIALAEVDMANLENYQVELKKINPTYLKQKYPKLESDILAYKIKIQEAKQALEDAQKREQEAQEAKELEEAKLAQEAKKKEEAELAEKLAKQEAEKQEAEKLAKETAQAEIKAEEVAVAPKEEPAQVESQAEAVEVAQEVQAPQVLQVLQAQRQAPQRQVEVQEGLVDAPVASLDSQIYNCLKLIEAKDFKKAENLAQNIVAENSNSSRAWGVLAKAYLAQNMYADAFLAAKQALSKDKMSLRANLLKIQMGIYVEGDKTLLSNLLNLDKAFPECSPVLLALARTYAYLGDGENSNLSYSKFFECTSEKDPLYADVLAEKSTETDFKKFDIKDIAKDLEL